MPSALRPIQVGAPVVLRDVSLRDGLQDEAPIPLADKVAIFEALVAAGVRDLELTSFVRPDRVPALADADQLSAATAAVTVRMGPESTSSSRSGGTSSRTSA